MPPINTKNKRLKGTHCFELPISQLGCHDLEPVCSIALDCNSLATEVDLETAVPGLFYTDPHDRVVSLRIIAESNSRSMHRSHGCREMHVHARTLLMWTQAHPAPHDGCFVAPWSAWGPSVARVVPPCMDDDSDGVDMCRSQSRFSGYGMRIVSAPSVSSGRTPRVTVTDYHPARVIRGRRQDAIGHSNATPTEIGGGSGHMRAVADAGRRDPSTRAGGCSRSRSMSLSPSMVSIFYTPG